MNPTPRRRRRTPSWKRKHSSSLGAMMAEVLGYYESIMPQRVNLHQARRVSVETAARGNNGGHRAVVHDRTQTSRCSDRVPEIFEGHCTTTNTMACVEMLRQGAGLQHNCATGFLVCPLVGGHSDDDRQITEHAKILELQRMFCRR